MSGVFQEWQQQNRYRAYPFADDASRMAENGAVLPADAIIDMVVFPVGVTVPLQVRVIDMTAGTIEIGTASTTVCTGSVFGARQMVFRDTYGRMAGRAVLGPSFGGLTGRWVFPNRALMLAATCQLPQVASGVQGILLPDGALLTGEVVITTGPGFQVSTSFVGGDPVVRFDAIGDPDAPSCRTDLPAPVACLSVTQVAGGSLRAVLAGDTVYIAEVWDRKDICKPQPELPNVDGDLPNPDSDPCLPPTPEDPVVVPEPVLPAPAACVHEGYLTVVSLADSLHLRAEDENSITIAVRGFM